MNVSDDVPEPSPAQIAAFDAGGIAYAEGRPSLDCPFKGDEPELRLLWVRGWVLARTGTLNAGITVPPTDPRLTAMERWQVATVGEPCDRRARTLCLSRPPALRIVPDSRYGRGGPNSQYRGAEG